MYEQEKQRANHLMILLCGTIFTIVLAGESMLLGWELGAVLLLLLGLGVSWGIYVTEKLPTSIQIWLYFIQTMLALFFYGIHETSRYDLAPLMIFVIIMYSSTEMNMIINLCIVTYYLTMGYSLVFVAGDSMELTALLVTRTLLHFALVCAAGHMAKIVIKNRSKERKNTENRIARLEETNSRAEDFLTNVSHELRTPINAVTGIAAVMLKNEEDAGKKKDILSIQLAGHRLFSQIEDILDYTEIDTGKLQASEDTYIISSLINDIIIGERLVEKANGLELIFDIDANLPSVLLGDGRKIKKIIKHLIDNAIKFTKKGAVYVRIYPLRKEYGINLCIRVSDTGIGIDEENLGKITETFFQFNGGRNRRAGGLGLGMPIVYGLTAAMEGFIRVESTVGSGTTVSVSIPQKIEDDSPLMSVADPSGLCLACYMRLEQYEGPEVRDYYNEMISHMACGLDITLHRAFDLYELKRLASTYQLTHLFIGKEEYGEDKAYFESLDEAIEVIMVADDSFTLPPGSRVKLFRKPFYGLSVTNILNARAAENAEGSVKARMLCPGIRVLVVDDEPMNLMVAEGIFKDYQMDVSTAGSGIEAVGLCEKNDYDLVFLDHMMPEMDGVETLKRIRQIHINTGKVFTMIAFTANAVSGAREMFLQEGFDEFVSKPVEVLELERVLRKVLPKSSVVFVEEKGLSNENASHGEYPENDRMTRLENVGVNIQSAMQYCRGDMDFYGELLAQFAREEEQKAAEMDDCFHRGDLGKYRILVHALKSSAKMVGADLLSEMAKKAEEAAKDQDTDYIREHHGEILERYHELTRCISQVYGLSENGSAQTDQGDEVEISSDELVRRLTELKEGLDTFEADRADALIAEMSGLVHQGTPIGELLHAVKQDVDDFELGTASGKVEALIKKVEGGETK